MKASRTHWWLSFVDPSAPAGEKNLGCTVVRADTMLEAIEEAWLRGINPGGEVIGADFPEDRIPEAQLAFMLNRLRSREEMEGEGIA